MLKSKRELCKRPDFHDERCVRQAFIAQDLETGNLPRAPGLNKNPAVADCGTKLHLSGCEKSEAITERETEARIPNLEIIGAAHFRIDLGDTELGVELHG